MKKKELKNGMAVIIKMAHGTFSDRVTDTDQIHGIWCERCGLVGINEIFPPTPETIREIDAYDIGGNEMLDTGEKLMSILIEPEFI